MTESSSVSSKLIAVYKEYINIKNPDIYQNNLFIYIYVTENRERVGELITYHRILSHRGNHSLYSESPETLVYQGLLFLCGSYICLQIISLATTRPQFVPKRSSCPLQVMKN